MRIVLLVADSLRADAPGFAGGPCRTPNLDRLAQEGACFSRCFTCAPWTVPSLAAMVTGVYAHELGLYRWEQALPTADTLFGAFADAGHRVASFVFDPGYLFSAVPDAGVVGSSQQLDAVVDWIDGCASPDLFVFVHYWATHFPYLAKPMTVPEWNEVSAAVVAALAKEPAIVRPKLRGMYQLAIERLDAEFLPRLAAATARHARGDDGWLLAVTGDHGESWGERGEIRDVFDLHGNHLRDEVLRVPLVLSGPRALRGRASDSLARTVDLGPTLLELAGAPPLRGGIDGVSLLSGAPIRSALAFGQADFVGAREPPASPDALWTQGALRTANRKLLWDLRSGERSSFDVQADPLEERPLAPDAGEPWAELERAVEQCALAPPPDLAAERLAALGYLG